MRALLLRAVAILLFMLPALFLAILVGKTVHEVVGHGLVARALGGDFTGFSICLLDVSYAHAYPVADAPTLHQVLISAGGIVSNALLGLLCLLAVPRLGKDSFLRFGFTILAAVNLLEAASYSFWGSYRPDGHGDPGTILRLLDREWLRWTVLAISSVALVGFTVLVNALVFQFLEGWLGEGRPLTGRRRLATLGLLAGLGGAAWWTPDWPDKESLPFMRVLGSALHVGTAVLLFWRSLPVAPEPRPLKAAAIPLAVSWGLALAVVLAVLVRTMPPWTAPPEAPPLPDPNGHDDLVRAGELHRGDGTLDPDTASMEDLRRFVEANREAMEAARRGLGRECRVPLDRSSEGQLDLTTAVVALRSLGDAFVAASRLAEREGDLAHAAACARDAVRLGVEGCRGGLVVHWLVSQALQHMGLGEVHRIARKLDLGEARKTLAELLSLESRREPLEGALTREREYSPWIAASSRREDLKCGCVSFHWDTPFSFGLDEAAREKRSTGLWRLLLTELAIRCFEARSGGLPDSLAALVPTELASVLRDPYAVAEPLVYRPAPEGYVLYSVGPNGRDDGGRPPPSPDRLHLEGDLSLDRLR